MSDAARTAPALGEELRLTRGPAWRNRVALAPLTNLQSNADGTLSDDEHAWLVARGRGGFGLTLSCASHVSRAGQAWPGQLASAEDRHLPGLTRLADDLRATGTVSSVQLHHGGLRSDPDVSGVPNLAPWADPAKRTEALTTEQVEQVVADFVAGAVRAERAGFDGVELHGAHGYLLCQFLDARHNHRTDRYGGSLENRLRIFHEVLDGIRAATGPDFQLGLRLTPEGNGIVLPEGRAIARELLATGHLDYLDMSLWDVFASPRGSEVVAGHEGDLLIDHFTDLPRHGAALGVAGRIRSAADARWALERGADFVSVGIGAILHHDWAARAVADPDFEPRPQPVTREELAAESVSPGFAEYLSRGWQGLVA
ncbi:NADH:flavin oxidoreductase [Nocardioides sp. TRM66260-LWL]|uniref:NADH:flavin oxidoreductase n=1 Tax=Nocardioides sp. TRM66260-LWL TaxID=2874478 RepID=UPI001CC65C8E|nr:NADH:flavin oxidoreductase [Nocardioides sp. TRM66260-LWL]MBZ5734718.1 NADH:flavin oxidoreductase [Nocardioides sp. TRM66260-LWL]